MKNYKRSILLNPFMRVKSRRKRFDKGREYIPMQMEISILVIGKKTFSMERVSIFMLMGRDIKVVLRRENSQEMAYLSIKMAIYLKENESTASNRDMVCKPSSPA